MVTFDRAAPCLENVYELEISGGARTSPARTSSCLPPGSVDPIARDTRGFAGSLPDAARVGKGGASARDTLSLQSHAARRSEPQRCRFRDQYAVP